MAQSLKNGLRLKHDFPVITANKAPVWVPNPPFANPGVAEKAPWRSLQSGVAGVHSLLEIPTDSCHFPSHLTPSSYPNGHFAGKALSATSGLAPGGLGTRQKAPEWGYGASTETNTTPTNANHVIRIAAQRTQGLQGPNSVSPNIF